MSRSEDIFRLVKKFEDTSIALATGKGQFAYEPWEEARNQMLAEPALLPRIPAWISSCRWGSQFWQFIKGKSPHYQGRREFIWDSIRPIYEFIERGNTEPVAISFENILINASPDSVSEIWRKIYSRRDSDPEGTITACRTLLESTCKYILDQFGEEYSNRDDLPKLYRKTASLMQLGPEMQNQEVFKQILSGCVSVVNGLASLRNLLGDAHGKSSNYPKPTSRHADLAINFSGTISVFLITTYEEKFRKR